MAQPGALDFPFAENLTQKCSVDLATFGTAVFSLQYEEFGGILRLYLCRRGGLFGGQQATHGLFG